MRNPTLSSLVGVLVLTLAACAATPSVLVDRDPTADLTSYKTFAFFDRPETDGSRYSTILTQHLKQATRTELERLGYVYDEHSPELKANFFLNVEDRQELRSSPTTAGFLGPRGYLGWGGYDLETVNYKAGTLRIDLVDTQRNALVWQGIAEGTVHSAALKNPGETLGRVVAEIFAGYPRAADRVKTETRPLQDDFAARNL